ncbi:MAG: hypothetical protein RL026_919 [Pseudomonadota bacterium]
MTRARRRAAWVVTVGAFALVGCEGPAPAPESAARPVAVATAATVSGLPPLRLPGVVAPREGVRLSFKTGGVLRSVDVREGDAVAAGQRLAQLESVEFDATLRQSAEALAKSERDLARAERLVADDVVPRQAVDDLRTLRDAARAQWEAVRFNQHRAGLRAPSAGRVLRRLAEPAETVAPGQPVLLFESAGSGMVLRVGVSDREVVSLSSGQAAHVELDALPDARIAGRVLEVPAAATLPGGVFEVSVALVDPPVAVRSGMVGRVVLARPAAVPDVAQVPIGAVVAADGDRAHVFVPVDGKARRREVEVAWIDGEHVALRSGLVAGEAVVTSGALFLADGDAVTVQ